VNYWDYEEYPKTLPRDDFWGQVRRTIYGRRVTEEELAVIIAAVMNGLELAPDDNLLDLMCGNGALTARLFGSCVDVEDNPIIRVCDKRKVAKVGEKIGLHHSDAHKPTASPGSGR